MFAGPLRLRAATVPPSEGAHNVTSAPLPVCTHTISFFLFSVSFNHNTFYNRRGDGKVK